MSIAMKIRRGWQRAQFRLRPRHLLIALGVGMVALVWAVTALSLWQLRRSALASTQRDLNNLALVLADQTSRSIQSIDLILQSVVEDQEEARKEALKRPLSPATQYLRLHDVVARASQIDQVAISDAKGRLVLSSRFFPVGPVNVAERDYFAALRQGETQGLYIGMPLLTKVTGIWCIPFARRLEDAQGRFAGVAVVLVTPPAVEDFYRGIRMGTGGDITLYRSNGTALAGYPRGEQLLGRSFAETALFRTYLPRASSGAFQTDGESGPRLHAYRQVPALPLVISVSVSADAVLASWQRAALLFGLVALLASGGAALLVSLLLAQQRRTERALEEVRAGRELLQAIFDTIPHAVYMKNREGRYSTVNRAMMAQWGRPAADFLGRKLISPDPPQEADLLLRTDERVLSSGESVDMVVQRTLPGGQVRHVRLIKSPLRDELGHVVGIVGVSEDVSQRVLAEQALRQSQALIQTVFDTIPHDMYVKDKEGRYLAINRAMANTFSVRPEQVIGARLAGGGPQEEREAVLRSDRHVLERGEAFAGEFTRTLPDGRLRRFFVTKAPLRNEGGEVMGLVGVAQDITEQVHTLEELQTSQSLLQQVINTLPQAISVKDVQGRYRLVNQAMAHFHYSTEQAVLGHTVEELGTYSASFSQAVREVDEQVLRGGDLVVMPEQWVERRNAPQACLRLFKAPLKDAAGRLTGVLTIAEDVTALKAAEARRLELERHVQHAQKLEGLGVLAGGIAHDFNNLLTGILGHTEVAQREMGNPEALHAHLQSIYKAGHVAADLVRKMLAYSGKGKMELQPLEMNPLVEEMVELLRVSFPVGVEVRLELAPELPPVLGDTAQLRQVVMNLLTNAVEAIGSARGQIVVSTGLQQVQRGQEEVLPAGVELPPGRYALLEVRDTGSGMTPEVLARIYEPFFSTKFTGRGLGMAAVQGIVRSHRGAIAVESQPGAGTRFRVLLPLAQGQPSREAPLAPPTWRGSGTVLLVDDDATVRVVLESQLKLLGFQVVSASGGAEALSRLRDQGEAVRVVLLDMSMPGMSGEDTLRALRGTYPRLPVVLCTGNGTEAATAQVNGDSLSGVLQKPVRLETLRRALEQVLAS